MSPLDLLTLGAASLLWVVVTIAVVGVALALLVIVLGIVSAIRTAIAGARIEREAKARRAELRRVP